ncbi:MAG: Holliday junction resolvase RuvX [Clostridia bacterium]|nr:Holliday junction resolvase RuvX [Clostridia bacterium]
MKRILGVDFGTARTGIAVSDPLGLTAQGIGTIHSGNAEKVAQQILEYIKKYDVDTVVVGLPKNMNNSVGERGQACIEFGDLLKNITDCNIIMWDERLSTVSAHGILNETNTRGKKRKNVVDTVAASIILQNYMDFKKG